MRSRLFRSIIPLFHPLRQRSTAVAVFVAGLLGVTLWALQTAKDERLVQQAAQRNRATEQAITLQERMHAYEQVLLGATALFLSGEEVTRERWRAHERHIGLTSRYPGVYGLGFVRHVQGAERDRHVATVRRDGPDDYDVRPEGRRTEYGPVVYLEPYDGRNRGILGYDTLSEPVRRRAAFAARDENRPVLTGPLVLLQDNGTQTPGVMLVAPVYRPGLPVATVQQRRDALYGWVYVPFRTQELIGGLLGSAGGDGRVQVFAGSAEGAVMLFGTVPGSVAARHARQEPDTTISVPIHLAGTTWTLVAAADEATAGATGRPALILGLGSAISLLLFSLTLALTRMRDTAQRRAEEAHRFLDAIVNAIPVPIFVKDTGHRTVLSNDANCALRGLEREEMVGRTDEEMFGAQRAAQAYAQDEQALANGEPMFFEESFTSGAGDTRWSLKAKTAMSMPDGRRYVVGVLVDMTERKRAEIEAVASRQLVDRVLDAAPLFVFLKDEQSRFCLANARVAELVGHNPAAMIGRTDHDFQPAELAERYRAEDRAVIESGETLVTESACLDARGNERWLLRRKQKVLLPSGGRGVLVTIQDLTERRSFETQLERSRQFLDRIINASPQPMFVKDREHRFVIVNDAFCALLQRGRSDLVGHRDGDFLPAERVRQIYERDDEVLASLSPIVTEFGMPAGDGSTRWLLQTKSGVELSDGSRYVIGVDVDITQTRNATLSAQQSKAFLHAILSALPIPVYVKDRAHRYVMVNEHFGEFFGVTVDEVLGKSDHDVLADEVARANWAEDDRILERGERMRVVQKVLTTSGRSSWLFKHKMAVRLPGGEDYVVGASIDITAQKEAALEAERSRNFLDAIINSMPQDIYVMGEDGRWLIVNDYLCSGLGQQRERLIGARPEDVLPAAAAARMREHEQAALASEGPVVREELATSPMRSGRWLLKIKYAIRTIDGARYLVGMNTDITERKRAEQRLRNFFDLSVDPLCIADVAGFMVQASPAFVRLLGCTEDALLRRPILDFVHPDDAERTRAAFTHVRDGAPVIDFVNRWRGSDGHWHWLQWRTSAADENGQVHAVARDITEARQREALIEHTHAMAQVGGWELDIPGRRLSWTDQTFRIHDTSPAQYTPSLETAFDFYAPADRPLIAAAVERAIASGEPWDLVLNLRTATGRAIIVRAQGSVEVDGGRPVRAFGSFQDVTALKAAEQELRRHRDHLQELVGERTREAEQARDDAVRANRAKSEFLTNMSHELRTPLHGILSFARLGTERIVAGESASSEKLGQYFLRIRQSGERLLVLLDDLLDLSRLEAGKMRYEMKPCTLDAIADAAIAEYSALAAGRSILFSVERATRDMSVWGDPLRLGQVLGNLISNAIKFSPPGGRIRVILGEQVRAGHRMGMVTVCDHGMGIPPDELTSIFGKFVQSSKTKSGAGGTGLGLAICLRIVSDHGGAIWAENLAAGGSAFSFVVPRAALLGSADERQIAMRSS